MNYFHKSIYIYTKFIFEKKITINRSKTKFILSKLFVIQLESKYLYFSFDILVMHLTFCVKLFLQCQLHGEVFTMFCTRKKTLLCMKCFRETSADAKSHCMDLETAYNVGGKRLERAITVGIFAFGSNQTISN